MDVDAILDTYERQGAPPSVVREVRTLLADEAGIDAERYQRDRAVELKASRRSKAVDAIVAEWRRLDNEAIARDAEALDAHAQAEHARVTSANGHAVDPHRFTVATTAPEIVLLLKDAEAADPDTLRRAWAYAEPRLRAMAQDEMRRHRQPGAGSAFTAMTIWQARMRDVTRRTPDRSALGESATRRRHEIKQQVLSVARVVSLDAAVEQSARKAAVPTPQQSALTVGGWFDRFGSGR